MNRNQMNQRILLPSLGFYLCCVAMLHGNPPTNKAAAAAAAALADKRAADEAYVQKHLSALKQYLPNIKDTDIRGTSKTDLRAIYVKAYEASGMHMLEARQKAAAVDFN
jgi:hypothetical protein